MGKKKHDDKSEKKGEWRKRVGNVLEGEVSTDLNSMSFGVTQ